MSETKENTAMRDQTEVQDLPNIRLRVMDRETAISRICEVHETESWDWKNPEIWRIINGWQITSYAMLLDMLHAKADKGMEEVQMLEGPRFMMMSGG